MNTHDFEMKRHAVAFGSNFRRCTCVLVDIFSGSHAAFVCCNLSAST